MKTRQSLVSNSSTSSFIIHYKHWMSEGKILLSNKELAILDEKDFRKCRLSHPTALDHTDYHDKSIWITNKKEEAKETNVSLGKWVTCNQDNEIYFLLKNKIPFIASVHYGHEIYLYPRNSQYMYVFENIGNFVETYHQDATPKKLNKMMQDWRGKDIVYKINVKKYIKDQEKWLKEYRKSNKDENKILVSK